jgi:3-oxoacyl-(acyl-carrier-protein) synthase
MRRVVISGLGVVAPNGVGREAFWSACVNGRSAVRPIESFDASAHPVQVAAEVPASFDVEPFLPVEIPAVREQRPAIDAMQRPGHEFFGADYNGDGLTLIGALGQSLIAEQHNDKQGC